MYAIRQIVLVALITVCASTGALAQAVGSITAGSGEILVIGAGGEEQPGSVGTAVNQYDTIYVGDGGEATVTFVDDTMLTLSGGSALTVDELVYDPGNQASVGLFNLAGGALALVSGDILKTGDMTVTTPVSTIGIRGTTVLIDTGTTVMRTGGSFNIVTRSETGEFVSLAVSPDGTLGIVTVTNIQTLQTSNLTQFGDTVTTKSVGAGPIQFKSKLSPAELKAKFAVVLAALQNAVGKDLGDPSNISEAEALEEAIQDVLDTIQENPNQDASPD